LGESSTKPKPTRKASLNGAQSGEIFATNYEQDLTHNKLAQSSLTALLSNALVNTTSVAMNIFDLDLNLKGITDISQVPGFSGNLPFNGYLASRRDLGNYAGSDDSKSFERRFGYSSIAAPYLQPWRAA
jgi:hypothetical protein